MPISAAEPIGVRRMTQPRIARTTASSERTKERKGSALSPTFSVARPTAIEMTSSCRMLNEMLVLALPSVILVLPDRARLLPGTRPLRKSSQPPTLSALPMASAVPCRPAPGCTIRPMARPILTAISAVIANQSRVWPARRAALSSARRLAIDATIAAKTRGGTIAFKSETKIDPTVLSVVASQLRSPSGPAPIWRATRPRARPTTMPSRTWKPKLR